MAGTSKHYSVECQADGTFATPSWPTCRPASECAAGSAPSPAADRHLVAPADAVPEFDYADYTCEADHVREDGHPGPVAFQLECESGGSFAAGPFFPRCVLPTCSFALVAGVRIAGGQVREIYI